MLCIVCPDCQRDRPVGLVACPFCQEGRDPVPPWVCTGFWLVLLLCLLSLGWMVWTTL